MKNILLCIFFLVSSTVLYGQFPLDGNSPTNSTTNNTGFPDPNAPKKPLTGKGSKTGRAAIDDSTRQIYGPNTMYYFMESDMLNSVEAKRRVDTTLHLFQRYLYTDKSGFLTQNLGNQGTAVRQVFIQPNPDLGTSLGYNAYMPYAFSAENIRYFNTKSPYSEVDYNLGAGGQTNLNFSFARNVDSLWNFGFELQRLVADKVLTDLAYKQGDQSLLGQWGIVFHSNYRTKNNKYRLLAHINYFDQGTKDQGGLKLVNNQSELDALKYIDNAALLANSGSESNDQFLKFHLYHEFIGFKGLQFFQKIDLGNRTVKFRDKDFTNNLSNHFYPKTYINYIQAPASDSLYNENNWSEYSHQTGIKGVYREFTYRTYLRQRFWNVTNPLTSDSKNRLENYVGLWLHQNFSKNIDFTADGEYLVGSDYRLRANFESPWFQASIQRTSTSPSIANNWVYNTSYRWNNDFNNVLFDQLNGSLRLNYKNVFLNPFVTIQRISNYTYFDTLSTAKQSSEAIGVFRTGVDVGGKWGKLSWFAKLYANTQTGPDVIRMPNLLADVNLALNVQYKKLLYMQLGIDLHHQSSYYADAYQPAIQQYHLQDQFKLPGFVQADVYVTMRINRVRLFFKFANVNQGLLTDNYYTSYLHPAMGRSFGYGVRWLLFD
ncbi:putative porin [Aquirufa sp. ROCK2-A2]